jgi:hypothetical protein
LKVPKWATVLKNVEVDKFVLVEAGDRVDVDDSRYGDEVHIVPVTVEKEEISFGVHDFRRECHCHPRVEEQVFGRTLVIHTDMVN